MRESDKERCAARVNLAAIRANFEGLRALAPGKKICSVIKADAYGHGAVRLAGILDEGTDVFAVATVDEGVKLREEAGAAKPILMLGPNFAGQDEEALGYGLTQTVFELSRAEELDRSAEEFFRKISDGTQDGACAFEDRRAHVHIAVDTGMSRIGLTPDVEGLRTVRDIMSLGNVSVDGIFTHFATADETDKTEALKACARFRKFKELCLSYGVRIPIWHGANTASVIDGIALSEDMDMVRLGIGLYGMYPSDEVKKDNVRLYRPMEWYAHVTFVKDIQAGTSVSYGYEFTADKPMRIATICCGYADGYPRLLSRRGAVLIRGRRCPILGRVCMDQFMVDVTDVEGVSAGDKAVLMGRDGGEEITPEEIAGLCGTINYEVTCDISVRVPRLYCMEPVQNTDR